MELDGLRALLEEVRTGGCPIEEALERLSELPFRELGFAKVDHHRALRCGMAEVIFGKGKTPQQAVSLVEEIRKYSPVALVTRAEEPVVQALTGRFPEAISNTRARTVRIGDSPPVQPGPKVVIVSAGTSDGAVVEEARETLLAFGVGHEVLTDVGIAGIHRLLAHLPMLRQAGVIIAVAGMEGALPSVVSGLVACPVVGVPTSIGYGAHLGGLSALLGMLTSCASGLSVVNIDNGFGAAAAAIRILGLANRTRSQDPSPPMEDTGQPTRIVP